MDKYIELAMKLGMAHAVVLAPEQIFFDPRAVLKCRWGCEGHRAGDLKCGTRGTSFSEGAEAIRTYRQILLLHGHDASALSTAVLKIERAAFLDGHYFAFALRACNLCPDCQTARGEPCRLPKKVRPCEQALGIDVYRTAREAGLPCQVLQSREEPQNRYGLVLIH